MFFLWRKVKVLTYKFKGYFHKVWILILYENYKMNKFVMQITVMYISHNNKACHCQCHTLQK